MNDKAQTILDISLDMQSLQIYDQSLHHFNEN